MKKTSKLHLSTETLRRLTASDLVGIAGARGSLKLCSNISLIGPAGCLEPATNNYDECHSYVVGADCQHMTNSCNNTCAC